MYSIYDTIQTTGPLTTRVARDVSFYRDLSVIIQGTHRPRTNIREHIDQGHIVMCMSCRVSAFPLTVHTCPVHSLLGTEYLQRNVLAEVYTVQWQSAR